MVLRLAMFDSWGIPISHGLAGASDEHPDLLRDPVHRARRRAGPGAELVGAVPRDLHLGGLSLGAVVAITLLGVAAGGAAARADRDLGRHHRRPDRAPGAPLGRPGGVGGAGRRLPVARAPPRPPWPAGVAAAADRDGRGRRPAAGTLPALRRRERQRAADRRRGRRSSCWPTRSRSSPWPGWVSSTPSCWRRIVEIARAGAGARHRGRAGALPGDHPGGPDAVRARLDRAVASYRADRRSRPMPRPEQVRDGARRLGSAPDMQVHESTPGEPRRWSRRAPCPRRRAGAGARRRRRTRRSATSTTVHVADYIPALARGLARPVRHRRRRGRRSTSCRVRATATHAVHDPERGQAVPVRAGLRGARAPRGARAARRERHRSALRLRDGGGAGRATA